MSGWGSSCRHLSVVRFQVPLQLVVKKANPAAVTHPCRQLLPTQPSPLSKLNVMMFLCGLICCSICKIKWIVDFLGVPLLIENFENYVFKIFNEKRRTSCVPSTWFLLNTFLILPSLIEYIRDPVQCIPLFCRFATSVCSHVVAWHSSQRCVGVSSFVLHSLQSLLVTLFITHRCLLRHVCPVIHPTICLRAHLHIAKNLSTKSRRSVDEVFLAKKLCRDFVDEQFLI